ncbi:hypothetical protein J3R30DRAFT_3440517 [Lentinula aciculospora]|uniref:Uncharacterized protein n=1 Tax=Lentinula aciculospora TaxID=153920 RepID=A0A9W9AN83_9AGAR|nr:hypothetical protein J3R30DRAFT_3440517 [Lentinula aciculospora]
MMMSNEPNVLWSRKFRFWKQWNFAELLAATLTLFYLISSHLLTELTRCSSIQSSQMYKRKIKVRRETHVSMSRSVSLVSTSFSAIFSSSLTSSSLTLEEHWNQWVANRPLNMMLLNAGRYYLIILSIRDSGRTPLPIRHNKKRKTWDPFSSRIRYHPNPQMMRTAGWDGLPDPVCNT